MKEIIDLLKKASKQIYNMPNYYQDADKLYAARQHIYDAIVLVRLFDATAPQTAPTESANETTKTNKTT